MKAKLLTLSLGLLLGAGAAGAALLETAPHVLDPAFEKAGTDKELTESLLNDKTFKKAVKEAVEAKKKAEKTRAENPGLIGASPTHQARQKFLDVINDKKPGEAGSENKQD